MAVKETEERKKLAKRYVDSGGADEEALYELNRICKKIYNTVYSRFDIRIATFDRDDYLQIGFITLWKVLEKAREKPDLINNFDSYLFTSVKHAFAAEFYKYVKGNPVILNDYEASDGNYNIANAVMLTDYLDNIRRKRNARRRQYRQENLELVRAKEREYWSRNKDKKAAKDKRYRARHLDQIREEQKQYREEHKEEIREKKRKYEQENREKINARRRRYWHEHLEECRKYHREYNRKRRARLRAEREQQKEQ